MKILRFLSLFILIHGPAFAAPVADIQLEGSSPTSKKRLLRLIPLQKGDDFDPAKLSRGVDTLRGLEIFEGVEAKTTSRPEGIFISIKLSEAKIISSININGHYPYIEAKIRKRLDLQVGEIWDSQRIEEQKKRIARFFERKGFYNTEVDVKTKPTDRKKHIQVLFNIRKGIRLRIEKVLYEGNASVPGGGLYAFIKPMDIYSETRMKNAAREMTQFYRNKGYLKVKVGITGKEIHWGRRRVALKVQIVEGPRVKVFFKGTRSYRLKTLKETITLFKEGNFDSIELKESARALRERFRQDGFTKAKVAFEKKKITPDFTHITFNIQPGRQTFIRKIEFEGNRSLSDHKIRKNLLNKEHSLTQKGVLNKEFLEEDKKLAKEVYQSEGYPYANISDPKVDLSPSEARVTITYPVEEGPLVRVEKIRLDGMDPSFEKEIFKTFINRKGKPFNKAILPAEKEQVEIFYKNHGYPYVQVEQSVEMLENQPATIQYIVEPGLFVTIGEIIFIGDVLTGVRPMKQAMGIRSGEPYNEQKILQAELNLRRLGVFTAVQVKPLGLEEKGGVIHLTVKVEERPPFVADLQTQFSTDRKYTGTFLFTNYNSFGWAKQTRLGLTGGLEKNRAELSWLDPKFSGSDFQMSLASWLDYEKRSIDTTIQAGGALSFFRQYRRFGFLTRYQLKRTYVLEGQPADPRSRRDSTLSEIGLSGSYDRRNSFADPEKGYYSLVGFKIFNEIAGARADFAKLKGAHSHYWSPFHFLTFATTLRADRIQDLIKAASIPQQELFGLGGDDTVRGFKEDRAGPLNANGNPLGGQTRIIFNQEMQLRLFSSLQTAIFYDGGTLTETWDDIDLGTYRHSFGFGARYITPVGPIRADYGIILDRGPNENFGRFHLTFGYLF